MSSRRRKRFAVTPELTQFTQLLRSSHPGVRFVQQYEDGALDLILPPAAQLTIAADGTGVVLLCHLGIGAPTAVRLHQMLEEILAVHGRFVKEADDA